MAVQHSTIAAPRASSPLTPPPRPLDTSRPAIVIDGASRGDIGVVRSLGFGGVPIHLLAANRHSPTIGSRFVTRVHDFPGATADDEVRVARLRAIAASLPERPVLLLAGDSSLRFVSRCRHQLEDVLDHDLAHEDLIETCVDKDHFAVVAARLGLPVPSTFVPASASEVRERAASLAFPVFVKPVLREDWARLPHGIVKVVKGQRVDTAEELVRMFEVLERHQAHRAVIQTLVQGSDREHLSVHAYVGPDGQILGAFSATKLRIWPPRAGVGAQVLSKVLPEPLSMAAEALSALRYTGFAILQFKRDAERDVYELLEINCRYSTWTELPSRAGSNFPLLAYAVMTGQTPPPVTQREGMSWLDFARDMRGLSTYLQDGEWTWGDYLRSLSTVRCWAFFAWDDPMPWMRAMVWRQA